VHGEVHTSDSTLNGTSRLKGDNKNCRQWINKITSMRRFSRTVCLGSVLALALSSGDSARKEGLLSDDSKEGRQGAEAPQAKGRIRTHVSEVIVPVTVTDKKGELVLNLEQKDFHVFDKGVEQRIGRFEVDADPLAVALIVETNLRLQAIAPVIRGMGSIFTETVMALSGEATVVSYDSTVEVHQAFTRDHDAVEKAIANLPFWASDRHLYDAMAKGVELLKSQPPPYRRILLVIGESQDYHSHAKLSEVMRDAQLANVIIYAVGPSSSAADLRYGKDEQPGQRPPPTINLPKLPPIAAGLDSSYAAVAIWLLTRGTNEISNHQLEVAAASTGGVHYRALHEESIRKALDRIGGELHAQYVLGYAPNPDAYAGFNEINVTVARSNVTVRTRPGYFVVLE